MKDVFAKFLCRSGTVCKDVAYEEISRGARKVHPFFHSEQPNAVLPLMICPFLRRAGRGPPLWGRRRGRDYGSWGVRFCVSSFGFWSAFLSRLPFFPLGAGLSSCVSATRRLVLSARTVCTISATICLSSSKRFWHRRFSFQSTADGVPRCRSTRHF